jgi:hypothetical protein
VGCAAWWHDAARKIDVSTVEQLSKPQAAGRV